MTIPLLRQIILEFAASLENQPEYAHLWNFTTDKDANDLILTNPNAFLYGAISDQQIQAERAWQLPYNLKQRLGHLDPFQPLRFWLCR